MKLALKNLPPLSPLAPSLLELSWEDNDAEPRLLRVIESDPALGARLLATANSVGYAAAGARYTTIISALRRLGLKRAIHLATSLLFSGPLTKNLPPALGEALWLHSLTLAYAAQELARVKRLPEPNSAYFIGLAHDLGYLAMEFLQPGLLRALADAARRDNLTQEEAELRLFGMDHQEVTVQLLELWNVPEELIVPLRQHHALELDANSMAAIVFGSEKIARSAEVAEVVYAGLDHPFMPLTIDRLGIDFHFAQQLELGSDAVDALTSRIIAQVDSLRAEAAAMTA